MASPTKKVKIRRRMKIASRGKARKNLERLHGSTRPDLALNKPNANEKAQAASKAKR